MAKTRKTTTEAQAVTETTTEAQAVTEAQDLPLVQWTTKAGKSRAALGAAQLRFAPPAVQDREAWETVARQWRAGRFTAAMAACRELPPAYKAALAATAVNEVAAMADKLAATGRGAEALALVRGNFDAEGRIAHARAFMAALAALNGPIAKKDGSFPDKLPSKVARLRIMAQVCLTD